MAFATPLKRIQEQLKAVDVLFEVRDARLPISSKHPRIESLFPGKPRIIILAKEDLADPRLLKNWQQALSQEANVDSLALALKIQKGKNSVLQLAMKLAASKMEARARKGLLPRSLRACVVGLPNVGKSSFINWIVGRKHVAVADRPGVTRGAQWVRIHNRIELLDSPGILPNFALSRELGLKLVLCNIMPADTYPPEEVATNAIRLLQEFYPASLPLYGCPLADLSLESVARDRNCLESGGQLDLLRAAAIFISDFRQGKLGRFVLDPTPQGR